MAFKQSGDNITAIGNITGISVNVNTQGGDSRVGYTIKQIHFHLIKNNIYLNKPFDRARHYFDPYSEAVCDLQPTG